MKSTRTTIAYLLVLALLTGLTVWLFATAAKRPTTDVVKMQVTAGAKRLSCTLPADAGLAVDSLLLANEDYPLAADYIPPDLVPLLPLSETRKPVLNKDDMMLRKVAYDALVSMVDTLDTQGLADLLIISAYRDYELQTQLYNSDRRTVEVTESGREITDIAKPGCSDHQLGLGLDIQTLHDARPKESFDSTRPGEWILKHGHKYGFVLRYPEKDIDTTGVLYEPWHFRYVGVPHAAVMNQKELCLEDYLAFLRESRTVDVVLVDNSRYQIIYYAPSENVLVPEGRSYTTSGDNMGGTIVTVKY